MDRKKKGLFGLIFAFVLSILAVTNPEIRKSIDEVLDETENRIERIEINDDNVI